MEFRNLNEIRLPIIIDCLLEAFADYFVPMPTAISYWKNRFRGARVNLALSYGCFDQGKLVGFITNGIDEYHGAPTAFNTGTGVIPAYRGRQIVDKLYAFSIPKLKKAGIQKCALEVIQANKRAIRVYKRIGFDITRKLKCFKGDLKVNHKKASIHPTSFEKILAKQNPNHQFYSWDNMNAAVLKAGDMYTTYSVRKTRQEDIGYFTINRSNGYLAQFEGNENDFDYLLNGISQVATSIKINNVDDRQAVRVLNLLAAGLDNYIDQYEMERSL